MPTDIPSRPLRKHIVGERIHKIIGVKVELIPIHPGETFSNGGFWLDYNAIATRLMYRREIISELEAIA